MPDSTPPFWLPWEWGSAGCSLSSSLPPLGAGEMPRRGSGGGGTGAANRLGPWCRWLGGSGPDLSGGTAGLRFGDRGCAPSGFGRWPHPSPRRSDSQGNMGLVPRSTHPAVPACWQGPSRFASAHPYSGGGELTGLVFVSPALGGGGDARRSDSQGNMGLVSRSPQPAVPAFRQGPSRFASARSCTLGAVGVGVRRGSWPSQRPPADREQGPA